MPVDGIPRGIAGAETTVARLRTDLWVSAHIRRCEIAGLFVYVVHRGDAERGAVLLKVAHLDGTATVYDRSYDFDGNLIWTRRTGDTPVAEREADDLIARQRKYDSDLWVLEIEDRDGRHELDEPVA